MRTTLTVCLVCLMANLAMAQNPKPPTHLTIDIAPDREALPIQDQVVLSIDPHNPTNLTVFIDTTSNPDDQGKLTTLEIKWQGEGGFNEEACDFDTIYNGDFDVCTEAKIAKVSARGFGPVYNLGEIIPEGFAEPSGWLDPDKVDAAGWIADGSHLTGGTFDKYNAESPWIAHVIPEPSSVVLLALGTLALTAVRRRR